jgi:hypothetical protein
LLLQNSQTLLALIVLCLACACAPRSVGQRSAPPPLDGLPGLAALVDASRVAASTASRPGADFAQVGGSHAVNGSTLDLSPAAGELAFAIYSFTVPAGSEVQSVTVSGNSSQPTAWLGVSDFAAGRWEFSEFDPGSGTVTVDRPASELTAAACQFYVAVVAVADALIIDSVQVEHNGDTLNWNHSWGTEFSEDLRYIGVDTGGNLYVAADHDLQDGANSDFLPVLLKYAPDGTLLAARQWTDPAITTDILGIRDFLVLSDGTSYTAWVAPADDRNVFLLKADANLNLLWCRKFDTGEIDSEGGLGIDSQGNIVLFLTIDPSVGDQYGMLLWLSPGGELVRQLKLTEGTAVGTNLLLRRIAVEPLSGDLLLQGIRNYPSPAVGAPSLMRLASDGSLKFSKAVTTPNYLNQSFSEQGVTFDAAGNMVSVCRAPKINSSAPNDHILLLRTDPAGGVVTARSLTIPGATFINSQRVDYLTTGEPMVEFFVNLGVQRYGYIRLSPQDATPLDWATFFPGGFDNDIDELCGSFYLGRSASSTDGFEPTVETGNQFNLSDISGEVALVDTGDVLTIDPGNHLSAATGSQLIEIVGTQDAPADPDVLVSRFIP